MKPFHETKLETLSATALIDDLDTRGYALLRGILPRDAVDTVLKDVATVLARAGWVDPDSNIQECIPAAGAAFGDPDPVFKQVYQQVFNLESFHALPHHASLRKVMTILAGPTVLVHPKPIGRLIFPHCGRLVVHAHQDYEFMRGDPEFFTAWIPLHDCPVEVGPLRILEGSHKFGIQHHAKENLHVPEIPDGKEIGDEWVGGPIAAGDVLIFHSLTVHAASPNTSPRMRLSLDCRFQNAQRVVHPSNLVFAGESGKSWDKTYTGWTSDALKFYWKNLQLKVVPSKQDLEELAEIAEPQSTREKYVRMASQLS